MLPGGVLGKKQLNKLKIYTGEDHPHSSQNSGTWQPSKPKKLTSSASKI